LWIRVHEFKQNRHEHFLPLFTQLFPNAPVHRLPEAGHYSPEDVPTEIAQLVIEFLRNSPHS
ncbi:MAG: alpha/beta fold hydrolase, partial [Hyphomicrobiaceae bacterium]